MAAELQRPPLPYEGRLSRSVPSAPSAPPAPAVIVPHNANEWFTSNYTIQGGVLLEGLSNFCKEGEDFRKASPAAMESYLSTYIIDAFHALVLTQSAEGKSLHTTDMLLNHLKGNLTNIFHYLGNLEAGDIGYTLFLSELLGHKIDGLTARKLLELRTTDDQCDYSIGPFIDGTLCYICYLPITTEQHFAGECEHILAVPDALFHTQLYQIKTNILNYGVYDQGLIKSEYKWAHRCCNRGKNDRRFMKRSSDGTRYVSADGFEDGINKTFDIMHSWRGPKNPSTYGNFIDNYGKDATWNGNLVKTRLLGKSKSSHNCNNIFPTKKVFDSIKLNNLVPYISPIVDTINSHLDVIVGTKQVGRVDAMLIYSMLTIFRFLIRLFHNPDLLAAFHKKFIIDGSEDNQVSISRPDPSTFEKVVNASNILYSKVDNKIKKVRIIDQNDLNTVTAITLEKATRIGENMARKEGEETSVKLVIEGIKTKVNPTRVNPRAKASGGMHSHIPPSASVSARRPRGASALARIPPLASARIPPLASASASASVPAPDANRFAMNIKDGMFRPNPIYTAMRLRSMGSAISYIEESRAAQSQLARSLAEKRVTVPSTKSSGKGNIASAANNSTHNFVLGVPSGTTAAAKFLNRTALTRIDEALNKRIDEAAVEHATISDALTCNYVHTPSATCRILDSYKEHDNKIHEDLNHVLGSVEGDPNEVVHGDPWVYFKDDVLDILIPSSAVSKSSTAAAAGNNMSLSRVNSKAAAAASSRSSSSTSLQSFLTSMPMYPTASTAAEAAAMSNNNNNNTSSSKSAAAAMNSSKGGSQYVDPYAIIQLDFPTELAFLHLLAYRRVYLEKMNLETISTEQYINTPGILRMALEHAGYHDDSRFAKLLARDHIIPRLRNNSTLKKRHLTRRQVRHRSHMGRSTARRLHNARSVTHKGRSTAHLPKHRYTLKHSTSSSQRV